MLGGKHLAIRTDIAVMGPLSAGEKSSESCLSSDALPVVIYVGPVLSFTHHFNTAGQSVQQEV